MSDRGTTAAAGAMSTDTVDSLCDASGVQVDPVILQDFLMIPRATYNQMPRTVATFFCGKVLDNVTIEKCKFLREYRRIALNNTHFQPLQTPRWVRSLSISSATTLWTKRRTPRKDSGLTIAYHQLPRMSSVEASFFYLPANCLSICFLNRKTMAIFAFYQ